MEINYQTIKNDCVQEVGRGQTVVRSEVDTRDRGGAAKLLSVGTDAVVTSVEAVAGEARVYGRVNYKITYLDEEGKMAGLDYFGEFDLSVADERIEVGDTVATAGVLDAECTLSAGTIRLETVVEARLRQIVSHQAEVAVDAQCECERCTLDAMSLVPIADATFEVVEEVESHHNIDRVLLFDAKAIHTDTRTGVDSVTVEGKVFAEVVYLSQGQVLEQDVSFDFAEQLDLESEVDLDLTLRQSKLVLTGEDDNNVLRIEAVLAVGGYRLVESRYEAVCDAYVDDADVRLVQDSFVCRRYEGMTSRVERVSSRIDAAEMNVEGGVVAATVARVNVANFIAGNGQITAEGLAVAGVLYRGEDGVMQAGEVELPFSVTFASQAVDPDCTLVGEAIAVGLKAAKTGTIDVDLLFAVKCYRPTAVRYVTDIEVSPCADRGAVMSVYFAAPDATVWEIARAVHVSPKALLQQNPDLATPVESAARRVLVFRHRELE